MDVADFKFLRFWIGDFAKFTDKGLCVSTESSDLLAKPLIGITDSEFKWISSVAGNFYCHRLQILGTLSGKHLG